MNWDFVCGEVESGSMTQLRDMVADLSSDYRLVDVLRVWADQVIDLYSAIDVVWINAQVCDRDM